MTVLTDFCDYLKTSSNPELEIHYLKNNSEIMKKKKSVTMEAEDIQKEEKLPLGRRFSSGDVPGNNINVCHIFLHFYVKYSLVTGEDCRVGESKVW
jgi:hypothetical protein